MTWKEKFSEWGGGDVGFLSEDGETITFIVVGEPVLLVGKFKGKESERIGCPVITLDGFQLLIIGKRLGRRLAKFEAQFERDAFTVVRHGEHEDIKTKYELAPCTDRDLTVKLFEIHAATFDASQIDEAVEAAEEIMKS